jgi:hypothetical protein
LEFDLDKTIKDALSRLFDKAELTDDEKVFLDYSNTSTTKVNHHTSAISTLLLTKQLQKSTEAVIESNRKLAEAEDKNSKKMLWLTWALIGVGTLQAIAIFTQMVLA